LVIDYDAKIVSSNGVEYTARTAPVILNTGAAGYGSSTNTVAASTYAGEGYINVSCGNRGKQDSVKDENGNVLYYTGDAPSCLVDQKCAARFVKYNILLGNLPGDPDRFVSTGGSGGGAHAAMFALTGNNPDFYDYEIAAGAVGIYKNASGGYSQTFGGGSAAISDGAWGCVAYSAITSLYEGDMTMAFEYFLDADYEFSTPFQKKVAEYLSAEYMDYINGKNLSVKESDVGFDLDGDGALDSEIALTIEYDAEKYPDTNGYGGSYLDLYLAEFNENLQWYLDNLDYAEGWTWFDADGAALSDEAVAAMTTADKAQAFIEGRYTKASSRGGMTGGPDGGNFGGGAPGGMDGAGGPPSGGVPGGNDGGRSFDNSAVAENSSGDTMDVGTPDAGTTQAAGSSVNSSNYASYGAMLSAYESDIAEISEGDRFGRNIVDLYNPLNYISSIDTDRPAWTRILMGASEGDMSMLASLNLRIAALNAGIDAALEWQWDGGHVPSEIFGESLALWVDSMYAKHVAGSDPVVKAEAEPQTANGTSESPTGTDISSWVKYEDGKASVTLADAVSYRTAGASKAIPGFDVIDYGQEDYVFGSYDKDARHWSPFVLKVLKANADILAELF
ncbi:MAG: hypothetical protein IJT56_09365, partial [Clostridia bacterium]|nr:hypothetical protein [Clostridia bacterium]